MKVSFVRLWVRTSRRRVHLIPTNYPLLRLPDWVSCSFQYGGQFFLGGCTLDDPSAFIMKLQTFWRNYKVVDPSLPFFRKNDESSYSSCVPIAIHGDEGRGRAKQPIMVISVQPLLPLGEKKSNMEGRLSLEHVFFFLHKTDRLMINLDPVVWWIPLSIMIQHPEAIYVHTAALHGPAFAILQEELQSSPFDSG